MKITDDIKKHLPHIIEIVDLKKDWRLVVGVSQEDRPIILTSIFTSTGLPDGGFSLTKEDCEANMTEDELVDAIEKAIERFPEFVPWKPGGRWDDPQILAFTLTKCASQIAKTSRRGSRSVLYNNKMWYCGNAAMDKTFIVKEKDGMFGLVLNPNFEKYGLKITD